MKVIALTLCLAALAQAHFSYRLKCTSDEIGIRWPSYYSNSEYYVCQSAGGQQMTAYCNAGELFTFVLQECSSPSKFIPPPPIEVLPTAAPITIVDNQHHQHFSFFPKPQHIDNFVPKPKPINSLSQNEIDIDSHPPIVSADGHQLPHWPQAPVEAHQEVEQEVEAVEYPVHKPSEDNDSEVKVPLPPTPPPTPPSLPVKKPATNISNKPTSAQAANKPPVPQASSAKKPTVPQASSAKKPDVPKAPTAKKPTVPKAPTAKKPSLPQTVSAKKPTPPKAGKKPVIS